MKDARIGSAGHRKAPVLKSTEEAVDGNQQKNARHDRLLGEIGHDFPTMASLPVCPTSISLAPRPQAKPSRILLRQPP
jgi:hypothetical protein